MREIRQVKTICSYGALLYAFAVIILLKKSDKLFISYLYELERPQSLP